MAIRTLAKFASTSFPQPLISSLWTGRRFGRCLHVWAGVFVSRRERTDSSCDLLATVCSWCRRWLFSRMRLIFSASRRDSVSTRRFRIIRIPCRCRIVRPGRLPLLCSESCVPDGSGRLRRIACKYGTVPLPVPSIPQSAFSDAGRISPKARVHSEKTGGN